MTTKTARKAKAACVWMVEFRTSGVEAWQTWDFRRQHNIATSYRRDLVARHPTLKFRIRRYIRQDP